MAATASAEDKFNAAVQIIRSLPKEGSYKPPYSMQLQFYSLYKQATEGECRGPRPSFWDIINRAKYDGWQALGAMDKETAMERYVDGFVATIKDLQRNATPADVAEALSYADAKHIALFRPLFRDVAQNENVPEHLRQMLKDTDSSPAGNKIDRHETNNNNHHDGINSQSHHSEEDDIEKLGDTGEDDDDTDDEEFSDTFGGEDLGGGDENHGGQQPLSLEQAQILQGARAVRYFNSGAKKVGGGSDPSSAPPPPMAPYVGSNREPFVALGGGAGALNAGGDNGSSGDRGLTGGGAGGGGRRGGGGGGASRGVVEPVDNLSYAVVRLQYTMDEVVRRLDQLERSLHEERRSRGWRLLGGVQPHMLAVVLGWPLLVQFILYLVRRRRLRVQLRLQ